jgi:hypothetical protein
VSESNEIKSVAPKKGAKIVDVRDATWTPVGENLTMLTEADMTIVGGSDPERKGVKIVSQNESAKQ